MGGLPIRRTIALLALAIAVAGSGTLAQAATPASTDDASSSELTSELPPPDLPTSNQQGYQFQIESDSRIDLDAVPREAPVYQLNWKEPTRARTERIAENLGIEGEVNDRGNG